MARIVLDEKQAAVLASAREAVEVCDAAGNVLGYVELVFSSEDIAEAKRRAAMPGKWHTSEQVLEHLRSLDSP